MKRCTTGCRMRETGVPSQGGSIHHVAYGVLPGTHPSSIHLFDHQGSNLEFAELEEALVDSRQEEENEKFLFPAKPPTLDIFPSWPLRSPQPSLRSPETTDPGHAQNSVSGKVGAGLEPESPMSRRESDQSTTVQNQSLLKSQMTSEGPHHHLPRTQEKRSGSDGCRISDAKTLRRLAQNREAARKSRLRKKAYVQQLESSRLKLAQLEQELQRARSQGILYGGGGGANLTSGAAMFDIEYGRWLEENYRHMSELRGGLNAHLPDGSLRVLVDGCLSHYDEIFRLKAATAKFDFFHLITGTWTTPAERCFLWMGGFRPSELIKILMPQLEPLTEQQFMGICNLQQCSQQAEDALSQGLEQLQQSLADIVASGSFEESSNVGDYMNQMILALGKLSNLEGFVRQADNLRQQTLHQMRQVLTVRQAARCLLAMGEYYSKLRALSSLWVSQPRESGIVEEMSCQTVTFCK